MGIPVHRALLAREGISTEVSWDKLPATPDIVITDLSDEDSSIDIQKVPEIRGYDAVTPIANLPGFVKGVVNLRGILVPIVDMRIKFNFDTLTCDELTVAIILNLNGQRWAHWVSEY